MRTTPVRLKVNGEPYEVEVAPDRFLVDLLRDEVGALEVKEACDEGECGSCTVLLDGCAVDSCIYLAAQCDGRSVTTVAGLSRDISSLQREFAEAGAVQCGFCTPGFIVAATAFLQGNPDPSDDEIRAALAGNLCRCTGYNNIVAAVRRAATSADGGDR